MSKKETKQMLWKVFEMAKQDRRSYLDAVSNVPEYVDSARKDLKDIEELQMAIFGKSEESTYFFTVDIYKLIKARKAKENKSIVKPLGGHARKEIT